VLIDASSVLMGCSQLVPETSLTSTEGVEESLVSLGSTQIVPEMILTLTILGSPQLLVNGLTEAQAWFLGWLRDGTRSHELLPVIDCFEVQTRRKNEVAPPPVCSMELPTLKAMLEVGIWDENREIVVRSLALSVAASLEDVS
jgi:hypothetical protein